MFFSIFVNIYFVALGQLLATTKSLILFIIEEILVLKITVRYTLTLVGL